MATPKKPTRQPAAPAAPKQTIVNVSTPAPHPLCPFLNVEQVKILLDTDLKPATVNDANRFLAVCGATGLNPLTRQIYATYRNEQLDDESWIKRLVIVTSIEGLRSQAVATGEYLGQIPPQWCNKDGKWSDVWLAETPEPYAAKAGVLRKDFPGPLIAVARYASFVQTKKKGDKNVPTPFWIKAPDNQLLKCAEAQALRKAFPATLSGLFIEEEIQPDNPEPVSETETEQPKGTAAAAPAPSRRRREPAAPAAETEKPATPAPTTPAAQQAPATPAPVEKPAASAPAPAPEPEPTVEEPTDPLFEDTDSAGSNGNGSEIAEFDHVIGCINAPEFSGKALRDLTVQQLERINTAWVIKNREKIDKDPRRKTEADAITKVLAHRKQNPN